jgi:hypothetical protein
MRGAVGVALGVIALGVCQAANARTVTYAVVVAQNRSLDPDVKPLRFADDDGVKNWELLSLYADRASLFVVPDDETARLHPEAVRKAEVPERQAVLERLRQYDALMAEDLARGDEPELFFLYAGHGDVDENGQGYVNLHDARLTRSDLFREVIAPSKARFVHVVIDACKSYFMVNSRGKRWVDDSVDPAQDRADQKVRAFLAEEQLEHYPRAGVIVATSGDQETHEWSRYRGGVLSHELRSALAGAADVNGDGRVEYSELRAFLAAANARVTHPEARVDVFARAPLVDRHRPLVDLRRAQAGRFLHFAPGLTGRFHVEDARGVRYADLHKEAGAAFDLLIAPARGYYVRRSLGSDDGNEEGEVRWPGLRRVQVASLSWHSRQLASRGAVEASYRKDLYKVPFGRGFYDGYVATSGDVPVEDGGAFVVRELRPRPRHHLGVGYLFSGPPAGQSGFSHGVDLRYAHRVRFLDLGVAGQIGHGSSGEPDPTLAQSLTRFALLGTLGAEWHPLEWLLVRGEVALGWQLLSGSVVLGGSRLEGAEGRGLRFEATAGLGFRLYQGLHALARGGFALDAVFPEVAASQVAPGGVLSLGLQYRL